MQNYQLFLKWSLWRYILIGASVLLVLTAASYRK